MTNREFFNSIIAENAIITEEMIEHAKEAIAKLDATAEKRKGKASKAQIEKRNENEALARHIVDTILKTDPMTATDVATAMAAETGEEVKVQKASYLCRLARDMGIATQTEVKIPSKGTQKGYAKISE